MSVSVDALPRVVGARSEPLKSVLAAGVYVILAVAVFASAWRNPGYLSVGTAGDSEIYMWMLGWVPYSISHGLNPMFSNFVVYPEGASLFWTLIPIVPGFVLSPVMVLAGPVATYNVTMTLGLASSAWCGFLAIRTLIGDALGSWLGGLLYGFSPYMLAHSLGHPNLVICVTPPLALWLLWELVAQKPRRPLLVGAAIGVLGAIQLLTTPEILFTTVLIGGIGLVVLAVLASAEIRSHARATVVGLAAAAVVFVALSAAPLAYAFLGPQQVHGVVREQDIYVTDVQNFVVPTDVMLFAPRTALDLSRRWTGDSAEFNGYIGIPFVSILAFVTLRYWSSRLIRWSAITAGITAVLSLGPHLHLGGQIHFHIPLPWLAVQHFPFFENVLPSRLMLLFYLLAGLALAFFVREIRRHAAGWRTPAAWAWVIVSLVLLAPRVPWPVTPNPVPEFFSSREVQRIPDGSVALVAPFSTAPGFQLGPGQDSATLPMLWQQASGMRFRMPEGGMNVPDVNGRPSGGRPPASTTQRTMIAIQQGGPPPDLTADLRSALDADISRWKIQTVIVGPMYNQSAMIDFFSALLGRGPQKDRGVYVWWDVGQ
jgi:hypothetical protein